MKKNFYILSALFLLLFVPQSQNIYAQRILQDFVKHVKAVPPANQYSARDGIDINGDVYWCVNTQDSATLAYSIHFYKYDTLAHMLWVDHYAGVGGLSMTDLKVLSDGTSYIWGNDFGSGSGSTEACFLQKHDASGNLLWTVTFDPDADAAEYADQIAISEATGDIIVTAYESSPSYKLLLARYNSNGENIWTTSAPEYETGDIAIDIDDNINLAGTDHWGSGENEIAFSYLKFDGNGNLLNYYKHTGGDYSHALKTAGKGKTIALDKEGSAYALSWVKNFPGEDSAWTHIMINKFDGNGSFIWKKRLENVRRGYPDQLATILVDKESEEAIIFGGWGMWKYGTDGAWKGGWYDRRREYLDACQYDQHKTFPLSSGNYVLDGDSGKVALIDWSDDYPDLYVKGRANIQPLNNTAIIEPDAAHNALYVTWSFNDSASLHRLVLRNEVATGVENVGEIQNGLSIYPNPVSEFATISFINDENSAFTLSIYNVSGQRIINEKFPHSQSTAINVKDLTPGIYMVTVDANGKLYHDKLVIAR